MAKRKTPEERADEERRYALARAAVTDEDFEPLVTDANQGIRAMAAHNPNASARILDRFADDAFWGTRIEVAVHPSSTRETLLRILEPNERKRGVVHSETRKRLESEGVQFGDDGMPE